MSLCSFFSRRKRSTSDHQQRMCLMLKVTKVPRKLRDVSLWWRFIKNSIVWRSWTSFSSWFSPGGVLFEQIFRWFVVISTFLSPMICFHFEDSSDHVWTTFSLLTFSLIEGNVYCDIIWSHFHWSPDVFSCVLTQFACSPVAIDLRSTFLTHSRSFPKSSADHPRILNDSCLLIARNSTQFFMKFAKNDLTEAVCLISHSSCTSQWHVRKMGHWSWRINQLQKTFCWIL